MDLQEFIIPIIKVATVRFEEWLLVCFIGRRIEYKIWIYN